MSHKNDDIKSEERRNFLKLTAAGSFTAAVVAGASGTLVSSEAAAQTQQEEREREKAADHVMTVATAYSLAPLVAILLCNSTLKKMSRMPPTAKFM